MKTFMRLLVLMGLMISLAAPQIESDAAVQTRPMQIDADPYGLMASVNALRAAYGLPAYTANGTLMAVAQAQADYMASSGNVTHYGPDGSRPFQRALAAGYPVAGDLNAGGFYSENIVMGNNMTPDQAVTAWMGDAPHQHTMLSADLTEIGAGVTVIGDYVYYVIDCARPVGAGSAPMKTATPGLGGATSIPGGGGNTGPLVVNTLIPNTPQADGRIIHEVARGETLWLIAVSYGTTVKNLQSLNGLSGSSIISPGMKLLIGLAPTPLPVTPTATASLTPETTATFLSAPTALPTSAPTLDPMPTKAAASPLSARAGGFILLGIVLAALVMAAFVTLSTSKQER